MRNNQDLVEQPGAHLEGLNLQKIKDESTIETDGKRSKKKPSRQPSRQEIIVDEIFNRNIEN